MYDADARPFLRRTDKRYDLIVVDAYQQPYVPFYLATREFFRLARERLTPGGILALNVASVPGDERLLDGISGTLTYEFPSVALWPALRFNKILLASDRPLRLSAPQVPRGLESALGAAAAWPPPRDAQGGAPVDRRPRSGRMGDRPDDRPVRREGRRARRGLPPDGAVKLLRDDGPLIQVGHRGAAALAPENTLRAFEVALASGVDAIEFDVLDRGEAACPRPLASLPRPPRSLELGPEPATLDEALEFLAGRDVDLHVDLKLTTRLDEVAGAIVRRGLAERAVVSSFHVASLVAFAGHAPQVAIGFTYPEDRYGVSRHRVFQPAIRLGILAARQALAARIPAMIERAGASALMLHHAVVTRRSVERAHRAGAAVWAWTVDDPAELGTARRCGGRRRHLE